MRVARRSLIGRTSLAGMLLLLLAGGGCYEHVVAAKGPRARSTTIHEPNLKAERIPIVDDVEDALFGEKPAPKKPAPRRSRSFP